MKLTPRQLVVLKEYARVGWCCHYPRIGDTIRALSRKRLIGWVKGEGAMISAKGQRFLEMQSNGQT